jgi:hypothetical protein
MPTEKHNKRTRPMRHMLIIGAALAGSASVATISYAQPSESLNVDVGACLDLPTREEQLQCYENRVADELRTRARDTGSDEPAVQPSDSRAASAEASSNFRRTEAREPLQTPRGEPEGPSRAEPVAASAGSGGAGAEIVSTIASVRKVGPDTYEIALENGQIWRQNRPKRYLLLEGAEVHLNPTHWGSSYRLSDPNVGGFIQVGRVQ